MAWRYHDHVTVDPDNPSCVGTCDRCGAWHNLRNLQWQTQWAGPKILNLRLLVCQRCLDIPAPFLRPPILSPDPPEVLNTRARIEPLDIDFTDFRVTTVPEIRETETPDDQPRIIENDTETSAIPPLIPVVPTVGSDMLASDGSPIFSSDGQGIQL